MVLCVSVPNRAYSLSKTSLSETNSQFKSFKFVAGDSLVSVLQKHGFSLSESQSALSQSILNKDFRFIKGRTYLVKKLAKQIEIRFYSFSPEETYSIQKTDHKVQWSKIASDFDTEVVYKEGKVKGSLLGSILNKFPSNEVAYRFMDAYLLDYKLKSKVQKGARFALHVEKQYDQGNFIKYGEVLNTSLEIHGEDDVRNFIRFPEGGAFSPQNNKHQNRPFYSPVNYIQISSTYRPRRFHPIRKRYIAHLGIDFALPSGEDVYAPQNGKVIKKGKSRGAGNYIAIRHSNGYTTYYNHLSKISKHIKQGLKVKTGEKIGEIGCTGFCTLSHLHFAIKKAGRYVNPAYLTKSYPYHHRKKFETSDVSISVAN